MDHLKGIIRCTVKFETPNWLCKKWDTNYMHTEQRKGLTMNFANNTSKLHVLSFVSGFINVSSINCYKIAKLENYHNFMDTCIYF